MRRLVQAFGDDGWPADLPAAARAALLQRAPRYNLSSHQPAAILRRATANDAVEVVEAVWGLVPRWSRARRTPYTTVTTRLARAARSRISGAAWKEARRCVLPLTGYYKYDRTRRPQRPWFVHAADGAVLLLAGLWERWEREADGFDSFTVLTAPDADIPAPLSPDGPVFLQQDWRRWLDGARWFPQAFLDARATPRLAAYPVGRGLRDPARDDYTLLEPVPLAGDAAADGAGADEDDAEARD